jgi:hypothetical protein
MIGAFGSVIPATEVDFTSESPEKCFDYVNSDEYDLVVTVGSITPLDDFYEIDFIDGDPAQIQEIEELLNPEFSLGTSLIRYFECSNLSFNITYHWENIFNSPRSTVSFRTVLVDKERFWFTYFNMSYFQKNHTVSVKGFNGRFSAYRPFIMLLK